MAAETLERVVQARPNESKSLERLHEQIDAIFEQGENAFLIGPDGERVAIPASAFEALRTVVEGMARGLTMTLVPHEKELTTQQAADLLSVSRPYLVRLLDSDKIPCHRVGTHRRILIEDVLRFRDERNRSRREKLRKLTELSEDLPGGYR